VYSDWEDVTSAGSAFQVFGSATGKARLPVHSQCMDKFPCSETAVGLIRAKLVLVATPGRIKKWYIGLPVLALLYTEDSGVARLWCEEGHETKRK